MDNKTDIWNSLVRITRFYPKASVRNHAKMLLGQLNTAGGKELIGGEAELFVLQNMDKANKNREEIVRGVPVGSNKRIAVIVESDHGIGIQFWTEEMIKTGESSNTDGTFSVFLEKVQ